MGELAQEAIEMHTAAQDFEVYSLMAYGNVGLYVILFSSHLTSSRRLQPQATRRAFPGQERGQESWPMVLHLPETRNSALFVLLMGRRSESQRGRRHNKQLENGT